MAARPSDLPVSRSAAFRMPAWFLWFCLAVLAVAPVAAAFIEDRPPRNEITQEQPGQDDDQAAEMAAALGLRP